jgi:hemerythrin superfamily protein
MDALAILIADHNRVRGLFSRFKDAKSADDSAVMGALAMEIVAELEVHTTIEEEIFYPWSRGISPEIGETVDEGMEEHHVVKVLMTEIGALDVGAPDWVAKIKVLMENVEHHADEEEDELFPPIRSHTKAGDREAVGGRLEASKAEQGAPVLADKVDLTDARLRDLAKEQAIPGRSKMNHDELAATVSPD